MIKDAKEKNDKTSIDTIREEKINEVILKFTDKNGNFDYENFKTYVKQSGKEFIKEGYGLNFLGKRAAELISGLESTTIFIPDTEHNEKEENKNSENIYISADNLEALRHLRHSYYKKIKCIYIDPPYNTGSDGFCYPDSFSYDVDDIMEKLGVSEEEANRILKMQSKRTNSHSAWLSFMYARLLIARDLLNDDGIIFISIDEHEMANLIILCNCIFGEENFISSLVWKCRDSLQHDEVLISSQTERILMYTKNIERWNVKDLKLNRVRKPYDSSGYSNPDNDPRGEWLSSGKTRNDGRPQYTVISPAGKSFTDAWIPSPDEFKKWEDDGLIWWGKNGDAKPRKKSFSKDFKGNAISDILFDESTTEIKSGKLKRNKYWLLGTTEYATENLKKLFNERNIFSHPKPVELLQYLFTITTSERDIILDFFSGSGSSAEACFKLNSIEAKERKFILCQLQDDLDILLKSKKGDKDVLKNQISLCDECNYPHTLDYIGIERIKRAAKKIKEETGADIDYGFKHFTLVDKGNKETLSMLERFDPNIAEVTQDEILNEFSIESRLITFLCDDGYGLTPKYEKVDLDGYIAYYIDKSLYLLDKGFDVKQNVALVKYIEKLEDNKKVNRLVIFGYAFSTREMQQLKDNLEKFEISDESIIVKY